MRLILDLDQIARLAEERRDEFEVMRYMLTMDDDLDDAQIDTWVDAIAEPIRAAIDCTQCGNCCRSLDVYLTPNDAQNLAQGLDIPLDTVIETYVDREAAVKFHEWGKFRARPCAFLKGNLCSIYPHRPETCRTYPQFTPDFRWVLDDLLDGAHLCPIIYNVLDAMVKKVDTLYLDEDA